jgi:hypothetical protein
MDSSVLVKKPLSNKKIYVFQNRKNGLIKIGISKDIDRRKRQLECASGCRLKTIFRSLELEDASKIEKLAHQNFATKRERGEWFAVEPDKVLKFLQLLDFG